jgi:hypothetical protein
LGIPMGKEENGGRWQKARWVFWPQWRCQNWDSGCNIGKSPARHMGPEDHGQNGLFRIAKMAWVQKSQNHLRGSVGT